MGIKESIVDSRFTFCKHLVFILVCSMTFSLYGQPKKVCKIGNKTDICKLKGKDIVTSEKTVALASKVRVVSPQTFVSDAVIPAIFFIIDNSGTMFLTAKNDSMGVRYRATRDLIDTIKNRFGNKAEVGFAVFTKYLFFRPEVDPIFQKCALHDSGSYVPLLKLDSLYPQNNKKGYDILKFYLDTAEYTQGTSKYINLKYTPNPKWDDVANPLTHINAGFDAAKEAFKKSKLPSNNHYIIFLSDGQATWPDEINAANKYIEGKDVPTTYTVFLTRDGVIAQDLRDMTSNIKKNGYSTKNPSSNIWSVLTDYPTLMKLLVDSVINTIDTVLTSEPKKLTVNGITSTIYDGKFFVFNTLFPLKKDPKTDFNYYAEYKIYYDTIINGKHVVLSKDSNTTGNFSITVQAGAVYPDSFDVSEWERDLGFYHNNVKIDKVDETMKILEMRFSYNPLQSEYQYVKPEGQKVVLWSVDNKDRMELRLQKTGSEFLKGFNLKATTGVTSPNTGDDTLEVKLRDSIIAVFYNDENPLLGRDTLPVGIPMRGSKVIEIKNAYYFDGGGDGYIDSIYLKISGQIIDKNVPDIIKRITWPAWRKLDTTTIYATLAVGGIAVNIKQKVLEVEPVTYVTDDDKLLVKEDVLPSGGLLVEASVLVEDKIAPIIKVAQAIKYLSNNRPDTLIITFSEQTRQIIKSKPFYFREKTTTNTYQADVALAAGSPTISTFHVNLIVPSSQSIKDGDSIWIYWIDNQVADTLGNFQLHETNTKRPLQLIYRTPIIKLTPRSTSPVNITKVTENGFIKTTEVDKFLNNANKADLVIIGDEKYIGMLLQVVPDSSVLKISTTDYTLFGEVSVYDALGNQIFEEKEMSFYNTDTKRVLSYLWNLKNTQGRYVGGGQLMAIFKVRSFIRQSNTEGSAVLKLMIGINRE
jgi:hypothetical protein